MYNSSTLEISFKQRSDWIDDILKRFHRHIEGLTKLTHFKPNIVLVKKTSIPDVYTGNDEGYLHVPDLKTSKFLRSKGDVFELKCERQGEMWMIRENIRDVK